MNPMTGQNVMQPPVFPPFIMRWTKRILWGSLGLVGAMVAFVAYCWIFYPAHQHCIKAAGLFFSFYETDHQGRLPFDTNGFGDALMLLVKSGAPGDEQERWSVVTGVGDDGGVFRAALASGAHIPEEKCSRIYVQGLSETNDPNIAILFDRYSTPGGDHFRRPWGPMVREVCLLDGSMRIIAETNWPRFSGNQIELLVANGIPRATAEHYHALTQRGPGQSQNHGGNFGL
jgi:hypothetical protein